MISKHHTQDGVKAPNQSSIFLKSVRNTIWSYFFENSSDVICIDILPLDWSWQMAMVVAIGELFLPLNFHPSEKKSWPAISWHNGWRGGLLLAHTECEEWMCLWYWQMTIIITTFHIRYNKESLIKTSCFVINGKTEVVCNIIMCYNKSSTQKSDC